MTTKEKIQSVITHHDWERLPVVLRNMSNSEFRRCETIVRTEILPLLDNDQFWEAFRHFVAFRPQAFLTGITVIGHLSEEGTLDYSNEHVADLSTRLSAAQKKKMLNMAIPLLTNEKHIEDMLKAFQVNAPQAMVSVLITHTSPLTYYILFKTLHNMPDNHDLCLRCCRFILNKGDDLSFNMASILREHFGLHEIQSQFSLSIQHYELSYIVSSFENFRYVLEGRRPKIL